VIATDLVTIFGGPSAVDFNLLFKPLLTHYVGGHNMFLTATLTDFNISKSEYFRVDVLDCVASIDIS